MAGAIFCWRRGKARSSPKNKTKSANIMPTRKAASWALMKAANSAIAVTGKGGGARLCGAVKSGAAQTVNHQRFAQAFKKTHFFRRDSAVLRDEIGA